MPLPHSFSLKCRGQANMAPLSRFTHISTMGGDLEVWGGHKNHMTSVSRNSSSTISEWPFLDQNFNFSSQNSWWLIFSHIFVGTCFPRKWNNGWDKSSTVDIYDYRKYFRNPKYWGCGPWGRKHGPFPTSNIFGGPSPAVSPNLRQWVPPILLKSNTGSRTTVVFNLRSSCDVAQYIGLVH